ncbi:MAG TPA: hypothetical protein VF276_09945 [Chloroflexia bacterium]
MSQAPSNRKKRSATTQNVKAAITVAAVAATVGGWAALSIADGAAAANAAPVPQTTAPAPQTSAPGSDQNPFTQQPGRRGRRPFFGNGAPSTGQVPGDQTPSLGGSSGDQAPSLGGSSGGQLPAPLGRSRSSR